MSNRECFVVMPFGSKPLPDAGGRSYDFDKVYRVIIQRAVREAGMQPVRADERSASALIHIDMFRDLRDRAVVVADLSLDNPNVFYELGIRHVMRPGGTVLMCRAGSVLPFDVKLSRVIFYDYDGTSLDWEEVERVVKQLKVALAEAATGRPDSPVHALLESVLAPAAQPAGSTAPARRAEDRADAEPSAAYQQLVASAWAAAGQTVQGLYAAHRGSVFGARALGLLALAQGDTTSAARHLANHLNDGQQYRLANRLYEALSAAGAMTRGSRLAWASSYSEAHPDAAGTAQAIGMVEAVLADTEREIAAAPDAPASVLARAECHRRLAGLMQWRWQCSGTAEDMQAAIAAFDTAIAHNDRARSLGVLPHPGFLAQARLKQCLLLRVRDGSVDRPDHEQHRDAILALAAREGDDPRAVSYLNWFQALTLADMGAADSAQRKAIRNVMEDTALRADPEHWEVGGRQYVLLRRFIEQHLAQLRHHTIVGHVAQALQAALEQG